MRKQQWLKPRVGPLRIGPCDYCFITMQTPVAIIHMKNGEKNKVVHPKCKAPAEKAWSK